jgi:hypothetical protein
MGFFSIITSVVKATNVGISASIEVVVVIISKTDALVKGTRTATSLGIHNLPVFEIIYNEALV